MGGYVFYPLFGVGLTPATGNCMAHGCFLTTLGVDVPHIVGVRDCRELLGGVWWYAFACVKIKTTADRMRDEAEEEEAAAVERANRVIFYTPEDTKHSDDDEDDEDTREEEFVRPHPHTHTPTHPHPHPHTHPPPCASFCSRTTAFVV
jgi:hypothetical protein